MSNLDNQTAGAGGFWEWLALVWGFVTRTPRIRILVGMEQRGR